MNRRSFKKSALGKNLERLIGELGEVALAETSPRQEGNQMHVILSQRAGRKSAPRAKADGSDSAATEES